MDDHIAVACASSVELDTIGASINGRCEGGDGVLTMGVGNAAMSDDLNPIRHEFAAQFSLVTPQ